MFLSNYVTNCQSWLPVFSRSVILKLMFLEAFMKLGRCIYNSVYVEGKGMIVTTTNK